MRNYLTILFLLVYSSVMSQSITSAPSRIFQSNTNSQDASGFVLNGFNSSDVLLASVGLVNPPAGTTFSITTSTGLSFATGYNSWTNRTRLAFTGTMANINNALASLKINTGSNLGNVQLSVSATVNPVGFYYNPTNGHFYRPISTGNTYTGARAASLLTTFKGQTGYLVTITSSDEDAFIFNNVPQSQIWFALTDEASEGQWRIDAGPEKGTLIKTSNGQTTGNIVGQYNNWAPGEPNNSGNEDYAVTKWNGSQWNDLPNNFNCPYVIEYGTWTNPQDQTFTEFFVANTTNTVAITNTLSGTVSIPSLTSRPVLNLFRVVNGEDIFVDTKTVASNGSYSFTLPNQNSTYKLVPSLTVQGITNDDFNLIFGEIKNVNTPNNTPTGLVMTGTKQWKPSDMNSNGILDLGDAFLVASHITGLRTSNKILWFTSTNYDLITKNNFGSIIPVEHFIINVSTSDVTQNIKYCILGDINLSHSSQ